MDNEMIVLEVTKRTDARLLQRMQTHYSRPRGFVGRNICYSVAYGSEYYGHIVGGSATMHLPGRADFLGRHVCLNSIVNNVFFNVSKIDGRYPCRNFVQKVIQLYTNRVECDWLQKYGDIVLAHETLVELPRTGDCYLRSGWTRVGTTKGFTCKRVSATGRTQRERWGGVRIWNKTDLRPKIVFMKFAGGGNYE